MLLCKMKARVTFAAMLGAPPLPGQARGSNRGARTSTNRLQHRNRRAARRCWVAAWGHRAERGQGSLREVGAGAAALPVFPPAPWALGPHAALLTAHQAPASPGYSGSPPSGGTAAPPPLGLQPSLQAGPSAHGGVLASCPPAGRWGHRGNGPKSSVVPRQPHSARSL